MNKPFISIKQNAYVLPAALYTLWQATVGWLNTWWTQLRMGEDFTTLNYVLFFVMHAIATACVSFRLSRPFSAQKLKIWAFVSAVFTGFMTASMAFTQGWLLVIVCLFSGIGAAFLTAYLSFYLFTGVPPEKRGITLGLSSGAGLAVHYVLFTLLPQTTIAALCAKTFIAAAIYILLAALSFSLPLFKQAGRQQNMENASAPLEERGSGKRFWPMVLVLLILTFFFISYGIQDFAATSYWLNGSAFLGHTRIFLILGFFAAGMLWDKKHRNGLLNVSFALLALGFIAMAFEYRGAASFIGFSGVQIASSFFAISARLIFLEVACFYKRPVFVTSLGFVIPMILKQAGIMSASVLYAALGGSALFVISLVCIALGFPLASLIFESLRRMKIVEIRKSTPFTAPSEDFVACAQLAQAVAEEPAAEHLLREASQTKRQDELPDQAEKPGFQARTAYNESLLGHIFQKNNFTKREKQILELVLRGLNKAEMAEQLNISEATVKQHIRNVLSKTDMKSMKQLIITSMNECGRESCV